jgi:hypothetical protein
MVLNKGCRAEKTVLVRLLRTVHGAHNRRELSLSIQECVPHTKVAWIVKNSIENLWKHNQNDN